MIMCVRCSSEYPEKCPEMSILVLIFNFSPGEGPPNSPDTGPRRGPWHLRQPMATPLEICFRRPCVLKLCTVGTLSTFSNHYHHTIIWMLKYKYTQLRLLCYQNTTICLQFSCIILLHHSLAVVLVPRKHAGQCSPLPTLTKSSSHQVIKSSSHQ